MANIVEYTLSLNDKISGKLAKIGIANDKQLEVWAGAQKKVNAADDAMSKCGRTIGTLQQRIDALKSERNWIPVENIETIRTYNKEIDSLERKMTGLTKKGRGVKATLRDVFNSTSFAGIFNSPIETFLDIASKAIKSGLNEKKTQVEIDVLVGNKNLSQQLFGDITQYGIDTMYDSPELQASAKQMLQANIAAETIMPTLRALGDIAMGDKEHLQSLALAFAQVSQKGKLYAQENTQFINAGFNPLAEIARTTGQSMDKLNAAMSRGEISVEDVRNAFITATSVGGKFYEMTEKTANTPMGKIGNISGNLGQALIQLYNIIEPIIIPALNNLATITDWLRIVLGVAANGVKWLFDLFNKYKDVFEVAAYSLSTFLIIMNAAAIKAKALAIWQGVVTIATKLWTLAQAALNVVMSMNLLSLLIISISLLVGAIVWVCTKITGWGSLWTGIINGMKYIFMGFISIITARFNSMINVFMLGLDAIKLGWYKFKQLIGWGDSTENQKAIAAINDSIEARKQSIIDGYKKAGDNFRKAGEAFGGIQMGWDSGEKKVAGSDTGAQLGISKPGIPGMNTVNTSQSTADGATGQPDVQTEAVTSGGSRSTTVNITLGSLVERIIYQGGYESNREAMERDIESTLIRVLSMARTAI